MNSQHLYYPTNYVRSFLSVFLSMLCAVSFASENKLTSKQQILSSLLGGGYVIYFRHAQTQRDEVDKTRLDIDEYKKRSDNQSCTTQRNLSADGRLTAKNIGSAFQTLNIPVGTVYTSPFCRCVDTAELAFGEGYTVSHDLYFAIKASPEEKQRLGVFLQQLITEKPKLGTNTIIVSHTANLKEAVDIWPKPEGVAHIFKPLGDGKYAYIVKMLPEEWSTLVSATALNQN